MTVKDLPRSFRQKIYSFILVSSALLSVTIPSYSSDRYFRCGSDEDGCPDGLHQYCICIPYNDMEANNRYCLDFDIMKCIPLSQYPTCEASLTFRNQNECLATLFQSEPMPPCTITTHESCLKEHSAICDADGSLDSCH